MRDLTSKSGPKLIIQIIFFLVIEKLNSIVYHLIKNVVLECVYLFIIHK